MAFSSIRDASSGLLAALKKGPRIRRRNKLAPVPDIRPRKNTIASLEPLMKVIQPYLGEADIERIKDAYKLADEAHLGQFRSSGEPYITHPIAVAVICAGWKLDAEDRKSTRLNSSHVAISY